MISRFEILETPHADVINLHCGIFAGISVPGGIPLALFLPEIAHRRLARCRPRLVVGNVDATVREESATHSNVQDKVELHKTTNELLVDETFGRYPFDCTLWSNGAMLVPDAQGLSPDSPENSQNPPSGGDTKPITSPSTLNVIPVGSHSRAYIWKSDEKVPLCNVLKNRNKKRSFLCELSSGIITLYFDQLVLWYIFWLKDGPKCRVDPIWLFPSFALLQVKSSFPRTSTISISPDRGHPP